MLIDNHRPKKILFVLKPRITNMELIFVLTKAFTFRRNAVLINWFGIFWSAPKRYSVAWALFIDQRKEWHAT